MKPLRPLVITFCMLAFYSCREGKIKQTESGMKYRVYREQNGRKPVPGDWVTVHMVYKQENDSVLFDSRENGKPLRFELPKPKFEGSFEEGLMYLGEGDSATFFINADSMFEKVILKNPQGIVKGRPTPGSHLKFDVSLVRVQTYQEAELEIALSESRQEQAEQKALEEYLSEKNIHAEKQHEGYYLLVTKPGSGKEIKAGDVVSMNYSAHFLNGILFNSSSKSGQPYSFTVGKGEVITGWDLAMEKLRAGDRALIVVPSPLAYGSEGVQKPNSKDYLIPPFSTLIIDVEVLKIEPSASR
jgi:FKBP-type peptidyl-prolyl cis-trans isomerase FkpA